MKLNIKVIPGAARNEICGWLQADCLKVKVRAKAEDGKANQAIIELFVQAFDIKPKQIKILSGQTSPRKLLEIEDFELADLQTKLDALLS